MTTEPTRYPVLPVRNAVLFPNTALPFAVVRPGSRAAADRASLGMGILVVAQRTATGDDPGPDELFELGTLATVTRDEPGAERNGTRERELVVHGIARFRVTRWHRSGSLLEAEGVRVPTTLGDQVRTEVLANEARRLAQSIVETTRPAEAEAVARLFTTASAPEVAADLACTLLPAAVAEKQGLLEESSLETRLEKLLVALARERERLTIAAEIQGRVVGRLSKEQREHVLREQLRALQEELGDNKPVEQRYRQLFQDSGIDGEALRVAEEELRRLENIPRASPEYHVIRGYLDTLTALPWKKTTRPRDEDISLADVEKRLDRSHSGLKQAKERFLEHLAMAKLGQGKRRDGKVLCLLGPPGVGKTSFAKAAAEALGRTFTRVSLGGLRDEAEIRGHRRTYVGAMPGRILQALRRAKSRDPLCLLDEIDKVASDWRGDPASALLEVLDPEQNATFVDHYVDVPFDLSEVFFVATANSLDPIPPALRDRMEVLTLPSYSREEKVAIARSHLLPRLEAQTPELKMPAIDDATLASIVEGWAREAGVRELGRALDKIARHAARQQAQFGKPVARLGATELVSILGPRRNFVPGSEESAVGRALALGWSPSGGQILPVEVERTSGRGQWVITGRLGDVMRESAQVAMTLARAQSDSRPFHRWDWHLHVPEGAVPKDGPSAGAALLVAVVSRVSGRAPTDGVAYTGEITLGGRVLAVGGIREKVLAAERAGLRKVVLPKDNAEELDELPPSTRERMELLPVSHVREVLRIAGLADVAAVPEPLPPTPLEVGPEPTPGHC